MRRPILVVFLIIGVLGAWTTRSRAERVVLDLIDSHGITLSVSPDSLGGGHAEVGLFRYDGEPLARREMRHDGSPFIVRLDADLAGVEPIDLYVAWLLEEEPGRRRRSLVQLQPGLQAEMTAPGRLMAGEPVLVFLQVRERLDRRPVARARCYLEVTGDDEVLARAAATSDEQGLVRLTCDLPVDALGSADLVLRVEHRGRRLQEELAVTIERGDRVLLTTDRNLYRPGQTVHVRALCLRGASLMPVAGDTAVFVFTAPAVHDREIVVRRDTVVTDAWGVATSELALGDPVPEGSYTVELDRGERDLPLSYFDVRGYTLPRWRLDVTTEPAFAAPGDTVMVQVQAAYRFGEPVTAGTVRVDCTVYEGRSPGTLRGRLSDDGTARLQLVVPSALLDAGRIQRRILLDATVTGPGGHAQSDLVVLTITDQPLRLAARTEHGSLEAGMTNTVLLALSDPTGRPVQGRIRNLGVPRPGPSVATDRLGLARLTLSPAEVPPDGKLLLLVEDEHGRHVRKTVDLPCPESAGLRIESTAVTSGSVDFRVRTSHADGSLAAMLIQNGQLLDRCELGRPRARGPVRGCLVGHGNVTGVATIEVRWTRPDGREHVRRRAVLLTPADLLQVSMTCDRPVYAPGDTAHVSLRVRDAADEPCMAIIGLDAVDTALLDLADVQVELGTARLWLPRRWFRGPTGAELPPGSITELVTGRTGPLADRLDWLLALRSRRGTGLRNRTINQSLVAGHYRNEHAHLLWDAYQYLDAAVARLAARWPDLTAEDLPVDLPLAVLVLTVGLEERWTRDRWDSVLRITTGRRADGEVFVTSVASAGIDGRWRTSDDLTLDSGFLVLTSEAEARGLAGAERLGDRWYWYCDDDVSTPLAGFVGWLSPFDVEAAKYMVEVKCATSTREIGSARFHRYAVDSVVPTVRMDHWTADPGHRAEEPRLRSRFDETACWLPRVITDAQGRAEVELPLGDQLTRWRVRGLASDRHGRLGDLRQWRDTRLDFFVDVARPAALTQGDRLRLPVLVHNGLGEPQTVDVALVAEGGLRLRGAAAANLELEPGDEGSVALDVTATEPGFHAVTVTAAGTTAADAMRREVRVRPDGRPRRRVRAGLLADRARCVVTHPADMLPGTGAVTLTATGDLVAECRDQLRRLGDMPVGCFEQSTSLMRLHALALSLATAASDADAGANDYHRDELARGAQSLPWYEQFDGGFGWFGRDRVSRIMCAQALWTLHDVAPWCDVDPDLAERTVDHLEASQAADGSWTARDVAPGVEVPVDARVGCTALVARALAETGRAGPVLDRALAYLVAHADRADDGYTLASMVLALAAADPQDARLPALVDRLVQGHEASDDGVFWRERRRTPYHGSGLAGRRETTALAVQALVTAGGHEDLARRGVAWLAANRDRCGLWGSTQATLQALRAFALAAGDTPRRARGRLEVRVNGDLVGHLDVGDHPVSLALAGAAGPGDHHIDLRWHGDGRPFWTLADVVHLPWAAASDDTPDLHVSVDLDRSHVSPGTLVDLLVRVSWHGPQPLHLPMVELNLPPGATLLEDALRSQQERGVLRHWEVGGGKLRLYLQRLEPGREQTFTAPLVARWPGETRAGAAHAWAYYDPDTQAWSPPAVLTVTEPFVSVLGTPGPGR